MPTTISQQIDPISAGHVDHGHVIEQNITSVQIIHSGKAVVASNMYSRNPTEVPSEDECYAWFNLPESSPTRGMREMLRLAFSSQVDSKNINRISPLSLDKVQRSRLEDSYRDF
jgi:hypothetical protein